MKDYLRKTIRGLLPSIDHGLVADECATFKSFGPYSVFCYQVREMIASITRASPNSLATKALYRLANNLFLLLGAPPIATVKMHDGNKMCADLRTLTEIHPYYQGVYEPELLSKCKQIFDPSSYFLDIGAHIGFYSVVMSKYIRQENLGGMVVSFEPHPGNFSRLEGNLNLNDLGPACNCFQIALSNTYDRLNLVMREDFKRGGRTGNASIQTAQSLDEEFDTIEVPAAPLDKIINTKLPQEAQIDFIKIDAEGHEDSVLEGAEKTIRNHKPKILIEVNRPYYRHRGDSATEKLESIIPEFYRFFSLHRGELREENTLDDFGELDNAFLIPSGGTLG